MLAAFADEHGITYDLLGDEGSVVLERLGLLNRHVEAQQRFYGREVEERHARLPYPGTILLDEAGTVVERLFEQSYRPRPSAGAVLRRAGGAASAEHSVTAEDGVVTVTASVDSSTFRPLEVQELAVEIALAGGWHVYTEPVPEGFVPLEVRLSADTDVVTSPPSLPAGRPWRVEGLDEDFFVLAELVRLDVPFMLPGSRYLPDGRARPEPGPRRPVTLELVVAYQACSDTECLPPARQRLTLTLEEEGLAVPR